MDKNLEKNENRLKKMLDGTQDEHMEDITSSNKPSNYCLETMKRKDWANQNKIMNKTNKDPRYRVDMIGSGNTFDSSKIEKMIAIDQYFNTKKAPTARPSNYSQKPDYSDAQSRRSNTAPKYLEAQPRYSDAQPRYSDAQPRYSDAQPRYSDAQPSYTEPSMQPQNDENNYRASKIHNDELFRRKSRNSVNQDNISELSKF